MTNVLFVCLGNICRSPTAHAVFVSMLEQNGLTNSIYVDSCGTGAWHIGHAPDERTIATAAKHGYQLAHLRARQLKSDDFKQFDYILAMDTRNLADIIKKAPDDFAGHLGLLLDFSTQHQMTEVPDPYYGDSEGFERVLRLIESACEGLMTHISRASQ